MDSNLLPRATRGGRGLAGTRPLSLYLIVDTRWNVTLDRSFYASKFSRNDSKTTARDERFPSSALFAIDTPS